jgi:protein-ribulosamine 3-kinase
MFEQQDLIDKILSKCLGDVSGGVNLRLIAAGNINQGIFVGTSSGRFFLKTNFEPSADIFLREAEGLRLLKSNTSLTVPEVIAFGREQDQNFLLMEWVESGRNANLYWENLGEGLAELHMATQKQFGLQEDNYIASLPQINSTQEDWCGFFISNRLEPLVGKAFYKGMIDAPFLKKFQSIYTKLQGIFPKEKPALIHGDLWSGNVMTDEKGNPALIDPAVYFGHREMDIAFSKLFGGFSERFYNLYDEVFPLEPGFEEREAIYNLYPLLVHLLLFGTSYLPPIEKTVKFLVG